MRRPKPTAFWGPQFAYQRLEDWPWPYRFFLQLHEMRPGEFWNDADGIILQTQQILTPAPAAGNFRKATTPIFFQYRHRPDRFHIRVDHNATATHTFEVHIQHGPQQFAYNNILKPEGVFAFGGYATLSREAT